MTDALTIPTTSAETTHAPVGRERNTRSAICVLARVAQAAEEVATTAPDQLVAPETDPYQVYALLSEAAKDNKLGLVWEMLHPEADFTTSLGSKETFLKDVDAGELTLPASRGLDFRALRLDLPFVYILATRGAENLQMPNVVTSSDHPSGS